MATRCNYTKIIYQPDGVEVCYGIPFPMFGVHKIEYSYTKSPNESVLTRLVAGRDILRMPRIIPERNKTANQTIKVNSDVQHSSIGAGPIRLDSRDCHKAAAILESASFEASSAKLMLVVANCLEEIAELGPIDILKTNVSFPFWVELEKHIHYLCDGEKKPLHVLHELAFELAECFAVIAREASLSKRTQHLLPALGEIMNYFENSADWAPNDGTLVSDYYYRLIPEKMQIAI